MTNAHSVRRSAAETFGSRLYLPLLKIVECQKLCQSYPDRHRSCELIEPLTLNGVSFSRLASNAIKSILSSRMLKKPQDSGYGIEHRIVIMF